MYDNDQLNFIDLLSMFSIMLQLVDLSHNSKELSNNELMSELQKQDREYLEKIIDNQNKILEKLTTLG